MSHTLDTQIALHSLGKGGQGSMLGGHYGNQPVSWLRWLKDYLGEGVGGSNYGRACHVQQLTPDMQTDSDTQA